MICADTVGQIVGAVNVILFALSLGFGRFRLAVDARTTPETEYVEESNEDDELIVEEDDVEENDESAPSIRRHDVVEFEGEQLDIVVAPLIADIVRATSFEISDIFTKIPEDDPNSILFHVPDSSSGSSLLELFTRAMPYVGECLIDGEVECPSENWNIETYTIQEPCDTCSENHVMITIALRVPLKVLPELTRRVHTFLYPHGRSDVVDV
jgi:hypothetical protein